LKKKMSKNLKTDLKEVGLVGEKKSVRVPMLFEDRGMEEDEDEVVFRFEKATKENECFTSLSVYKSDQNDTLSELYVSKSYLCHASPVFKAMFSPDSKFEENQDGIRICDFPRISYLAFFRMIHPTIFKEPSSTLIKRNLEHTYNILLHFNFNKLFISEFTLLV